MFGTRDKKFDAARAVVLDDLNIRKYGDTVRRIFFPVWPEAKDWNFRLDTSPDWAWACDFKSRVMVFSTEHFEERDLLRAALISQIAMARSGPDSAEAWISELARVRNVASTIGREQIANFVSAIIDMTEMNVIDIRRNAARWRVETYLPSTPAGRDATIDDQYRFQDSLHVHQSDRENKQARDAITRLGLK